VAKSTTLGTCVMYLCDVQFFGGVFNCSLCLVGVVYGGTPVVTANTLHIGYSPFLGEPLLFFVVRFPKLLYDSV